MDWSAVAAVGELVGALAVVVSLVYLAAQIRQNTRQVEEQTRAHQVASMTAVSQAFTGFRTLMAGNPVNADLWAKASKGLEGLSAAERNQYDFLLVEMFWAWAMPWLFVQQGVFDSTLWDQARHNLGLYSNAGVREWWQTSGHRAEYPPDFAAAIDEVFSELPEPAS